MKQINFFYAIAFVLMLTITFGSCSQEPVFEKYVKMKAYTWDRFDIKTFDIPVKDAEKSVDITLVARNIAQFPYDNLPVYVILTAPSGEERMREVSIPIRNVGKMLGTQTGTLYESRLTLWKGIKMGSAGNCKITIENMIPKIQTEGIDEIGILVTKSE